MNLDRSIYAGSSRRRHALLASSVIGVASSVLSVGLILNLGRVIQALAVVLAIALIASLSFKGRNIDKVDPVRVFVLASLNVLILVLIVMLG